MRRQWQRNFGIFVTVLVVSACAGYAGRNLMPGVATEADVLAAMGEPALRWRDADGSVQLAFPRGPTGVHTFMAFLAPDGHLIRLENVLEARHFARLRSGKDGKDDVLRLFGPPSPARTAYFSARDELVWEWLFCDEWNRLARFDVLFDGTTGLVRTSYQQPELRGPDGAAPTCSR